MRKLILILLFLIPAIKAQTHNILGDTNIVSITGVDTGDVASVNGISWLGYPAGGGGATPFYTVDLEEGDLSEWTGTSGANLSASTDFAHSGSYSLKIGTNSVAYYEFSDRDTVYLTFWLYLPSTSSQSATTNYISMFNWNNDDRTCFCTNDNGGGTWEEWLVGVSSGDLTDGDFTTNFSEDTWHKIKMYYMISGGVSYHQVWVDGTSIWNDTNTYTNAASNFSCGSEAATITNYFYIDDINIYENTDPDE